MLRILVTGASGYIGQHVIYTLLTEGFKIRGLARRSQPAHLAECEWVRGDIAHLTEVQAAIKDCQAIIHLACRPLGPSWQDPIKDFQVNAAGTLNVLQAARLEGVQHVVYTSTAQVYGDTSQLPIPEDTPAQPTSPYAAHKICGELLCTSFTRCYGLNTTVLRLFNVYGAALDQQARPTVETIFLKRSAAGLPPLIKGDPKTIRDFIHIQDVVRAIRLGLNKNTEGAVINIGSGKATTLLDLAQLTLELTETKDIHPIIESNETKAIHLQADTRKAQTLLDFQPEITLSAGLRQLLTQIN